MKRVGMVLSAVLVALGLCGCRKAPAGGGGAGRST